MSTKTKIPISSEKEDTEKKMAVANEPTGNLKIVIMNTGHNKNANIVNDKAEKRKQVIGDVVKTTGATLFLFQEFTWKGIIDDTWGDKLPSYLKYTGNKEACILFDKNKVTVEEMGDETDIRTSTLDRMCIRKVKTMGDSFVEFICISWHGAANEMDEIKIEELKSLLECISNLSVKLGLPLLLAGDFNLNAGNIETQLSSLSLVLHKYEPAAKRRKSENIIDFFISSESLEMSGIKALTLESQTKVAEVLSLFDHDPVVSFMSTKTENKDPENENTELPDVDTLSLSSKTSKDSPDTP